MFEARLITLGNFVFHPGVEVLQPGDRPAHHKVVFLFQLFHPFVFGLCVIQAQGSAYFFCHHDLFANGVCQVKLSFRKKNGQGNAGKSTPGTCVQYPAARFKAVYFGNAQRVQHMLFVKVANVFSRYHIHALVPVGIEFR